MIKPQAILKRTYDYLIHSDITLTLSLNPFAWIRRPIEYEYLGSATDLDPGLICYIRMRFFSIAVSIYIDDGSW
jgi:hypothetical protein